LHNFLLRIFSIAVYPCLFPLPLFHTLILLLCFPTLLFFVADFLRLPNFPVAVSSVVVFLQLLFLPLPFLP